MNEIVNPDKNQIICYLRRFFCCYLNFLDKCAFANESCFLLKCNVIVENTFLVVRTTYRICSLNLRGDFKRYTIKKKISIVFK